MGNVCLLTEVGSNSRGASTGIRDDKHRQQRSSSSNKSTPASDYRGSSSMDELIDDEGLFCSKLKDRAGHRRVPATPRFVLNGHRQSTLSALSRQSMFRGLTLQSSSSVLTQQPSPSQVTANQNARSQPKRWVPKKKSSLFASFKRRNTIDHELGNTATTSLSQLSLDATSAGDDSLLSGDDATSVLQDIKEGKNDKEALDEDGGDGGSLSSESPETSTTKMTTTISV